MKKLIGYGIGLAAIKASLPKETIDELWDVITMKDVSRGVTSGLAELNKKMEGMSRISFNVGMGKISFRDLFAYFSDKFSNLWHTGGTLQVIIGMILLIVGAVFFFVAPVITIIKYIVKGFRDKANFNINLRSVFMILGIEATIGLTFILFCIRVLNW